MNKDNASIRRALAALSLSMLMSSLGTSIANVALPTLAQAFDTSFQHVQWIVLAYLLAVTALIVSAGRLGDLTGRRRLLLAGISLFTVASGLCGLAPSLPFLIAARAAQGLGGAVMMALTMAFVAQTVPKEKTGSAMGLLGTMSAAGTALGPSVGGLLIQGLGWQSIFLINIPLGVIALILGYHYLPADIRDPEAQRPGFDYSGTVLLASMLIAYALAMTAGRGDFGALNAALLFFAVAAGGLFLFTETKISSPLIDLRLFSDPILRAGFITSALVSTVLMATLVVGPFYLSRALGLEPALVGFVMTAGPAVVALTGIPAGRAVDRWGEQAVILAALSGIATGAFLLSLLPAAWGIPAYLVPIIIVTLSYALFQTANNTQVMRELRPDQRGVVSGILNLSRNMGLITGASVMGAIFAFSSGAKDISTAMPDAVAHGMHTTFLISAVMIVVAVAIAAAGSWKAEALGN